MPNIAFRKLTLVTTMTLDGNPFHILENGCIHDINVKFLSISRCPVLERLEQSSISNLDKVESIDISNNPHLAYFHPGAVSNTPSLKDLLLDSNNLTSLENIQSFIPTLKRISLNGNMLKCHCSLRWIQEAILSEDKLPGLMVRGGGNITCGKNKENWVWLARRSGSTLYFNFLTLKYGAA